MMKRLTVMILAACITTSMIIGGCGVASRTNEERNNIISEESTSQGEDYELEENITTENNIVEDNSELNEYFDQAILVSDGETYQTDNVLSIHLDKAYWVAELLPENPTGAYQYLKKTEGYTYLVIQGGLRNLGMKDMKGFIGNSVEDVYPLYRAACRYAGEYYQVKMAFAEADGSSLTSTCNSGEELPVYFVCTIPNNLVNTDSHTELLMGYDDFDNPVSEWDASQTLLFFSFDNIANENND